MEGEIAILRKQFAVGTGLPSLALANGSDATGVSDIAFDSNGNALVLLGWGGEGQRDSASQFAQIGTLIRLDSLNPGSSWTVISDLFAFEQINNPDGQGIDSNPFALTIKGNQVFIADAAANDTLSADTDGNNLSLQAVFSNRDVQNPFAPPGTLISIITKLILMPQASRISSISNSMIKAIFMS